MRVLSAHRRMGMYSNTVMSASVRLQRTCPEWPSREPVSTVCAEFVYSIIERELEVASSPQVAVVVSLDSFWRLRSWLPYLPRLRGNQPEAPTAAEEAAAKVMEPEAKPIDPFALARVQKVRSP